MKSFSIVSVAILLVSVSSAHENIFGSRPMRPSQWLTPSQLEQTPSVEEISLEKLENMSAEKGAELVEKIYHLSQMNHSLRPNFVPSPSTTLVYIYEPSGQKVTTTLDKMAAASTQLAGFGDEEVTIFITGMPASTESVRKANRKLIEAYRQRYSMMRQEAEKQDPSGQKMMHASNEEDSREGLRQEQPTRSLMVVDLGAKFNNFNRIALVDTEQTGTMIASAIMDLMNKNNIADEAVHIIAQGIAAHIAGAAGREYERRTGHKLRRITALDPSKLYAKDLHTLAGLARGDAEFVDAIHTNAYGLGTADRVGDVDFYPHGPSNTVPGAKNIVEASMRATRYFAESVRPGQERNFPAVAANSLKEFLGNDGYGRRAYMGIETEIDAEGDYILEVNDRSPFGKRTPGYKRNANLKLRKSWKPNHDDE